MSLHPVRSAAQASISPTALRTDYAANPLGIDAAQPSLSWRLQPTADSARGLRQTAYQLLVATHPDRLTPEDADVWNTGKVVSDRSVHVRYDGRPVRSRMRYYWTVRVWDEAGRVSSYSDPAWWEMGLLDPGDWNAQWIAAVPPTDSMPPPRPAPMFRKGFELQGAIESARLYISGLGYYEAYLNGQKIGDHVLDPMLTHYDRRVKYVTYDVTERVRTGGNALGVMLGNGWYNQHTRSAWDFDQAPWRAAPTALAQLEITYADGSRERITTGDDWAMSTGPIVFDGIRNGEHYDARNEQTGWTSAGFDDTGWKSPVIVDGPAGPLTAQAMPPIRVIDSRPPQQVREPEPDVFVYDFGQNLTGWTRLQVSGPRGAEITIRYGERLYDDGTLDQEELSRFIWTGETQTDRYILKGEGLESWHPRFVYHGFRYAEITTSSPDVTLDTVTADVVHTDLNATGHFESSNELLNQIHQNTLWSYLGNFHGYPTDCPHREKIGWSGDAHLAAEAGLYNFDAALAYRKWIDDFVDEQQPNGQVAAIIPTSGWGYDDGPYTARGRGPQWEGAFLLVPWYTYLFTGDDALLERFYGPWTEYVDYLARYAEDYIVTWGIDDHKPAYTTTDPPIIATGHFYACARIVQEAAERLGHSADAARYARLADNIRAAYHQRFFNPGDGSYGNGGQTSIGGALYHGLVPPEQEARVFDQLLEEIERRDGHIDAGVVGTKYVLNVLTEYDAVDVAYRMATKTTYPSWGHWVERGATTLWQNWDGSQSRNHVMFGSIDDWLYKALAGIRYDPEQPGFKHTLIEPAPVGDLTWVEATHTSMYGAITSNWRRDGDRLYLDVEIPANTTARVHVPTTDPTRITEGGVNAASAAGVTVVRTGSDVAVYDVGSGSYQFVSPFDR
jgi:alpha-L-rhamnosidase